jgi:hypothetical protein
VRSLGLQLVMPVFGTDRVKKEGNHSGHHGGGENDVQGNKHVRSFTVVC